LLTCVLNHVEIAHLVFEKFKIQPDVNFKIVKINDVVYEKLFNLLVYVSVREKLFKNNMLILHIPNKRP